MSGTIHQFALEIIMLSKNVVLLLVEAHIYYVFSSQSLARCVVYARNFYLTANLLGRKVCYIFFFDTSGILIEIFLNTG